VSVRHFWGRKAQNADTGRDERGKGTVSGLSEAKGKEEGVQRTEQQDPRLGRNRKIAQGKHKKQNGGGGQGSLGGWVTSEIRGHQTREENYCKRGEGRDGGKISVLQQSVKLRGKGESRSTNQSRMKES